MISTMCKMEISIAYLGHHRIPIISSVTHVVWVRKNRFMNCIETLGFCIAWRISAYIGFNINMIQSTRFLL